MRLSPLVRLLRRLLWFGSRRHCTVCGARVRRFLDHGTPGHLRPDARCPVCFALERHRLTWLFFQQHTDLFDGRGRKRMLHVAPEKVFDRLLRQHKDLDYITGDLADPRAMVQMDATAIPFPDRSFDIVYCSHVLEHIPDDRAAMREMRRVLREDGWAVLQVPIQCEHTEENPDASPEERTRRFGQPDHVRNYGRDFADRLREAGFQVTEHSGAELLSEAERRAQGIRDDEPVFFCRP